MKRIGIISDTHGFLDDSVFTHFKNCDELWHAGDFGPGVAEKLQDFKPLKAVFGNIDDQQIRLQFPEQLIFQCEEVKVMMRHIGGSPPAYNRETKSALLLNKPDLFISGHSHILKVIFDNGVNALHINPGAAGKQGWHKMRTLIRLTIDGSNMKDCEIIELGRR
jgi:putative phosphoesterase